jgi:hypothetical protein
MDGPRPHEYLASHGDGTRVEIDVAPLQADQLAAPRARRERELFGWSQSFVSRLICSLTPNTGSF